ncbi:MAG: MmgE/PrpD family protein [Alphaproteobacteria bacterium]|nr:MmgE/PrpD family protein [Alphaproteobacteria bacterium]
MPTQLARWARWATALDLSEVPADVLHRARLRQLSVAGAARASAAGTTAQALLAAGPTRGSCNLVGTDRTLPRREAVRYHVAAVESCAFDDHLFHAPAGAGAVAAGWAWARERSLGELLLASVIGMELAGRLALACTFTPRPGPAWGAVQALATAAAGARLAGLTPEATAHALALAIAGAGITSWPALLGRGRGAALSAAALVGLDAVDQAAQGLEGPTHLLDTDAGWFADAEVALPLRGALDDLDERWVTRALAHGLTPGSVHLQVPVEGVHEILRRHLKAAEKRLRSDQVDRIVLRTSMNAWSMERLAAGVPDAMTHSVARSVAALIVAHELGPAQHEPAWQAEHQVALDDLAARVTVEHHWPATVAMLEHLLAHTLPFVDDTRALLGAVERMLPDLPRPGLPRDSREWVALLKQRPDRLLRRLLAQDAEAPDLSAWRYDFRAEIKLYTTRGGWWPERRDAPEGSNGWPPERNEAGVFDKLAQGHAARREAAPGLLERPLDTAGTAWLDALR